MPDCLGLWRHGVPIGGAHRPIQDESEGKKDSPPKGTDEEILKLFYDVEDLSVKEAEKRDDLPNKVLIEDVVDADPGSGPRGPNKSALIWV